MAETREYRARKVRAKLMKHRKDISAIAGALGVDSYEFTLRNFLDLLETVHNYPEFVEQFLEEWERYEVAPSYGKAR